MDRDEAVANETKSNVKIVQGGNMKGANSRGDILIKVTSTINDESHLRAPKF